MKRRLIVLLTLLLLTGCAPKETAAPEEPVIHTPVETEKITNQPEQEEPVKMEPEIVEETADPEEIPSEDSPLEWEVTVVEGLVEDTIGYSLEQPVFSGTDGAAAINEYYAALVPYLENHTREKIYPEVMEKQTMANVYGTVQVVGWNEKTVQIEYLYRIEYLNGEEPEEFIQTDRFDLLSGERLTAE